MSVCGGRSLRLSGRDNGEAGGFEQPPPRAFPKGFVRRFEGVMAALTACRPCEYGGPSPRRPQSKGGVRRVAGKRGLEVWNRLALAEPLYPGRVRWFPIAFSSEVDTG